MILQKNAVLEERGCGGSLVINKFDKKCNYRKEYSREKLSKGEENEESTIHL